MRLYHFDVPKYSPWQKLFPRGARGNAAGLPQACRGGGPFRNGDRFQGIWSPSYQHGVIQILRWPTHGHGKRMDGVGGQIMEGQEEVGLDVYYPWKGGVRHAGVG